MALYIASGSRYIITNAKSGKAADVSGVDNRASAYTFQSVLAVSCLHTISYLRIVIGFDKHGGENQQWEIQYNGDGWHIKSVASGKYLALEGSPSEGTKVIAAENQPFNWHIWPDTKDIKAARYYLSVHGYNMQLT